MPTPFTLCFAEAQGQLQERQICEEQYFHHVLAHFNGTRHDTDKFIKPDDETRIFNEKLYAHTTLAIRSATLNKRYKHLRPASILSLEALFQACASGDLGGMQEQLKVVAVNKDTPAKLFITALATLAVEKRNVECLRLCLVHGARIKDDQLSSAIEETGFYGIGAGALDLLHEYRWKRLVSSKPFRSELVEKLLAPTEYDSLPSVRWLLEHGVDLSPSQCQAALQRLHDSERAAVRELFALHGLTEDMAHRPSKRRRL